MNTPISEFELRNAARRRIHASATKSAGRVFEEFGIEGGNARADLALVNSRLIAYELKSDLDSFRRMHNQIHAYGRVFDRVTIATGPAHLEQVIAAVPSWWGIWSATRSSTKAITLRTLRLGKANPSQDMRSVATLLWREECRETLITYTNIIPHSRATRSELQTLLVTNLARRELRHAVTQCLLKRQAARAEAEVSPTKDLDLLANDDLH